MNFNTPAYRVWNLTAAAILDGAVLSVHSYTVKVEREGNTLTAAYVDGQPVSIERAAHLLTWARDTGTVKQVEAFDPAPALTLGKPRASGLHRILSRLGLGHSDHYRAASAALSRPVDSLAALSERTQGVTQLPHFLRRPDRCQPTPAPTATLLNDTSVNLVSLHNHIMFMKRRIIPNPPRLGRIANFLFWFLVAAVVHFAFRYIFQISDSGTSPGYQDTPLLLSSIKDGLFLILAVSVIISALISRQFKTSPLGVVVVAVFVIMLAFACLRIALDVFAFDVLLSIRSLWVPTLLVLIVELIPRKQAGVVLLRVGQVLTPIVLLFQAVTVVLYLVAHRLPALSYVGNPRFGGILDDPNGYGVLCVLLMAVIWGRTHLGWLVALAVNVLMTVSLSAITILLIYLAFQFVRQIRWNRAKTLVGWTFLGTLTLISGISVWNQFGEQIIHWWEQKSPSVQDHASSSFGGLYTLSQNNFAQLAIGNVGFSENQWVLTALNSGFIGLVLQIILLVWLLIRCLKQDWSVGAWGVAVVVASALIPYLYVYPISVLFWAMLALGARQTRREIHGNTINRLMSDTSNITVPHPDYQGR